MRNEEESGAHTLDTPEKVKKAKELARRLDEITKRETNFCHPENPGSTHWLGCACHEAARAERLTAADAEIARLTALLHECNAVCLCGCPASDHEADECGESCGHDDHECIRVAPAVLAYVEGLRKRPLPDGVREAAEKLRDVAHAPWKARFGICSHPQCAETMEAIEALLASLSPAPAPEVKT